MAKWNPIRKSFTCGTDQAPSMIKGIKDAKITFPNLNHITCLAHSLHRVCESIRINNEETDKFIASMK